MDTLGLPYKIQIEVPSKEELYSWLADTPLAQRVKLEEYVPKVLDNAVLFACRLNADNRLIGIAILYMNDPAKEFSFLTYIRVNEEWRKKGISTRLFELMFAEMRKRGFSQMRLEVKRTNLPALCLYRKMGFVVTEESGDWCKMGIGRGKSVVVL